MRRERRPPEFITAMVPITLHPHPAALRLRHDHRVRAASTDWDRILRLRGLVTDRHGATALVAHVCATTGLAVPRLGFHARRRPDTGHTRPPREVIAALGHTDVDPKRYPATGHIQLSATPTLGLLAHELGHLLVFDNEPLGTPAHGLVWVRWQDAAAELIEAFAT